MSAKLTKAIILGILLISFQILAKAQSNNQADKKDRNIIVVGAAKTLKIGGKAAYIVVRETSQIAWATTKFTAGEIAAPVAKTILVKATPKISLFVLKQSGLVAKKAAPIALKAAITYMKL